MALWPCPVLGAGMHPLHKVPTMDRGWGGRLAWTWLLFGCRRGLGICNCGICWDGGVMSLILMGNGFGLGLTQDCANS